MNYSDTIAAPATAVNQSGIGIIRISGSEAFEMLARVFKPKRDKDIKSVKSHTAHFGYIIDQNQIIDEVLVLIMRGPNSYTAEDTAEIQCHGGILVINRIMEVVVRQGARVAEPGEFTKRAFLNGRMDLSQAEAVMDLIHAKNEYALKSSVGQMHGSISSKIRNMREEIIYHIAKIESALDDPEHISLEGYPEKLKAVLLPLKAEIERLLSSFDNGRRLTEGVKTVIMGKPNAGKSSLMNLLMGEERAIVTEIAGTTRDTLEEQIQLGGISLNIIDTAGIRETEDIVEKIGVTKAMESADDADLIIYVVDSSVPLDENDTKIIDYIKNRKGIVLLNKSDLDTAVSAKKMEALTEKLVIAVSAKENLGIELLETAIKEMFFQGEVTFNDEVYLTNVRHKDAFREACESINMVLRSIEDDMPEDFYSIDLMAAYERLGTIIGESVEDDLVDQIFSKFCMGK